MDYLKQSFLGNSLLDWLITLAVIVGSLIVAKLLYWFFGNVARKLTSKTETRLDDIIVDMVEEPIVFALALGGIWYGISMLTLPEGVDQWIAKVSEILIVLSVGWLIVRLFDALVKEYIVPLTEKTETDLDDQLLPVARKGVKFIIWGLTIVVALNNAGYDVGALLAGLGIGGLALAMAAKDTVSNIFGGFTIFTDRPFSLGDRIKVAGFDGSVTEIGIRSTRLQTLAGTQVTIPNREFTDNPVENVSSEPSRKISLDLGLTYDTPPDKMRRAQELLREIVSGNEGTEEKILCAFNGFGDFAMNIMLIYYITKGADILGVQNEINLSILDRFNGEGLEFAFPTQMLFTKTV